ncbi:MAG: hypothetical protein H0V66_03950 [Bdellovibrionales bacterium]|nr:hypothetical protein [Bdellovibrionales bacterium]
MRRLIVIFIAFLSTSSFAHEVQLITQHIKINRQNESAWQSDFLAKAVLTPKLQVGLQGTYLERFDLYENRAGGFFLFNPTPSLTLEARYLKGDSEVEILPRDQYTFSLYHSLTAGFSPYIIYQNSLYSITHLQTMRLGIEIEKIRYFIIIPQVMFGQAEFNDPSQVKEVNSFGVKVIYYKEQLYSLSAYAFKGIEAAQAIVGRSSETIETKSVGAGVGYYFFPHLKTEFIFDYTDLGELDNQFLTSTLNMVWAF